MVPLIWPYDQIENRNSKSQITNIKQTTMTKIRNSKHALVIEYWNLRFVCYLVLGVWDLIDSTTPADSFLNKGGSSGYGFLTNSLLNKINHTSLRLEGEFFAGYLSRQIAEQLNGELHPLRIPIGRKRTGEEF